MILNIILSALIFWIFSLNAQENLYEGIALLQGNTVNGVINEEEALDLQNLVMAIRAHNLDLEKVRCCPRYPTNTLRILINKRYYNRYKIDKKNDDFTELCTLFDVKTLHILTTWDENDPDQELSGELIFKKDLDIITAKAKFEEALKANASIKITDINYPYENFNLSDSIRNNIVAVKKKNNHFWKLIFYKSNYRSVIFLYDPRTGNFEKKERNKRRQSVDEPSLNYSNSLIEQAYLENEPLLKEEQECCCILY